MLRICAILNKSTTQQEFSEMSTPNPAQLRAMARPLPVPKVGDMIVITTDESGFYAKGARARLVRVDPDFDYWADFRGMSNPPGSFNTDCNGTWCVGTHIQHFTLEGVQ